MARVDGTLYCDGCGVEVLGAPFARERQQYCCRDCADGLACECQTELERKEESLQH